MINSKHLGNKHFLHNSEKSLQLVKKFYHALRNVCICYLWHTSFLSKIERARGSLLCAGEFSFTSNLLAVIMFNCYGHRE